MLSRLLLTLTLVLFGASQAHVVRWVSNASPAAVIAAADNVAILTAQSHQMRAPLPLDDVPVPPLPVTVNPKPSDFATVAAFLEQPERLFPISIAILPPVRAPPVV